VSFITPRSVSHRKLVCAGAFLAGFFAGSAQATDIDSFFFFRGGATYANFDGRAHIRIGGAAVPGSDASASTNTGAEFELCYQIDPR